MLFDLYIYLFGAILYNLGVKRHGGFTLGRAVFFGRLGFPFDGRHTKLGLR